MFSRPVSFVVAGAAGTATLTAASAPSPLYPVYRQLWGFSAITLTVVFAVYVFALLGALLTVGSLSDRVGRRPVASAALVLLAIGMVLFAVADGTGGLIAARIVQGLAVGAATGTMTALILDTAPGPRSGSIVSSAVPTFGIAIGAVLAGALVEYAPHPRQLVFWILAGVQSALAVLVWLVPERPRDAPTSSLWRSLRPSAGVPRVVRGTFLVLVPSMGATWALGGLYLSLGSSVLGSVLGVSSHFSVGLVLGAFFVAGTAGTALSPLLPSHRRDVLAHLALGVGVAATTVAMLASTLPLYVVGSVLAGLGFGAAFRQVVHALGEAAPAAERGQVFATMFIVSYLAFSLPALVAGVFVEQVGLRPTAVGYGVVEVALVVVALVAGARQVRRGAVAKAASPSAGSTSAVKPSSVRAR